jgi:hypothetical protein
MIRSLDRQAGCALLVLSTFGLATSVHSEGQGGGRDDRGPATASPSTPAPARVVLPIRAYQQTTSYTCGPAAILTLLRFYKKDGDEMRIAREAKCSPEKGTSPRDMAAWLEANGFEVAWGEGGTLRLLRDNLARGVPTLVEWIDWGGHWVLVVGYDTRGTDTPRDDLILFADPSDTHDGQKDGLTEFHAARFQAMWFDAFLFERPMHRVYITATPRIEPSSP